MIVLTIELRIFGLKCGLSYIYDFVNNNEIKNVSFEFHYIFLERQWFSFNGVDYVLQLGFDGISFQFIRLTTFLFPFVFYMIKNQQFQTQNISILSLLLLLIEFLLVLAFSVLDIFLFVIIFEIIIILTAYIVCFYGSKEKRHKAFRYFFMYSFIFSLFSITAVLLLLKLAGSTNYIFLLENANVLTIKNQRLIWFLLFLTFSAKVPMFPFHIWLPKAHVESTTVGSVVLAGLLLKLGGYGIVKFLIPLFPQTSIYFASTVQTIALFSILVACFGALVQLDLKKIIAYSSIVHMNYTILGLFSLTQIGIQGAIYGMLCHGLVASGLFILVGKIQDTYGIRNIKNLGGLVKLSPKLSVFFFYYSLCNIGIPTSGNFLSEF